MLGNSIESSSLEDPLKRQEAAKLAAKNLLPDDFFDGFIITHPGREVEYFIPQSQFLYENGQYLPRSFEDSFEDIQEHQGLAFVKYVIVSGKNPSPRDPREQILNAAIRQKSFQEVWFLGKITRIRNISSVAYSRRGTFPHLDEYKYFDNTQMELSEGILLHPYDAGRNTYIRGFNWKDAERTKSRETIEIPGAVIKEYHLLSAPGVTHDLFLDFAIYQRAVDLLLRDYNNKTMQLTFIPHTLLESMGDTISSKLKGELEEIVVSPDVYRQRRHQEIQDRVSFLQQQLAVAQLELEQFPQIVELEIQTAQYANQLEQYLSLLQQRREHQLKEEKERPSRIKDIFRDLGLNSENIDPRYYGGVVELALKVAAYTGYPEKKGLTLETLRRELMLSVEQVFDNFSLKKNVGGLINKGVFEHLFRSFSDVTDREIFSKDIQRTFARYFHPDKYQNRDVKILIQEIFQDDFEFLQKLRTS